MSAHLAIPATTTVLRRIVEAQLKTPYTGMTVPTVHTGPPPRPPLPPPGGGAAPPEEAALHLYLHHVAANPAWRTMLDPAVDESGVRLRAPPLVLDLHYMLAATGASLEREVLLGLGMTAFHRNPIVAKAKIAAVLGSIATPANPSAVSELVGTEKLGDPASQPESLTIAPSPLDIDLSTKLWSALQAPIRPCAYYLVTTLFLESDAPLAAGPLVKDVGIDVGAEDVMGTPGGPARRPIVSPVP